jgi:hypothetical protein
MAQRLKLSRLRFLAKSTEPLTCKQWLSGWNKKPQGHYALVVSEIPIRREYLPIVPQRYRTDQHIDG